MSHTRQILKVRVGRVSVLAGLFRKPARLRSLETFAAWASSGNFASNRFHYTLRRQPLINHTVDEEDGAHVLRYWGPMTHSRVMGIVKSIQTEPILGFGSPTPSAA